MRYLNKPNKFGELILLIDKSELDSGADAILKLLEDNFNNKFPTYICVGRTLDSSIDSSSNYLYTAQQMKELYKLEAFYQKRGLRNALKFSELNTITNDEDFDFAWPFDMVIRANKKIDNIVDYMHKLKLTPFEAMLYVHMYVSRFQYKETANITKWDKEISRVILGMATNQKFIVCSGHSSFGKAIIDKYNDPDLCSDFSPIQLMDKSDLTIASHEQLVVTLKDKKYNISGIYGDDICSNIYEDDIEDISACLFPLEDINNMKDFTTRIMRFNNRYEEIISPSWSDKITNDDVQQFIDENKNRSLDLVATAIKRKFERQVDKNAIKSEPIPYDTYLNALFTIMYKTYCVENNLPFDRDFNISNLPTSEIIDDATIDSFNAHCYQIIRKSIKNAQSLFSILKSKNTFCLAPYYEKDPMIEDLKFSQP